MYSASVDSLYFFTVLYVFYKYKIVRVLYSVVRLAYRHSRTTVTWCHLANWFAIRLIGAGAMPKVATSTGEKTKLLQR